MLSKTIEAYSTVSGREPFTEWYESLRDKQTRMHILERLERIALGNFGDYEFIGEGVFELRFFFGSGLRVYFSQHKGSIILLLCGGNKQTQTKDIRRAKEYWKDYKERRL